MISETTMTISYTDPETGERVTSPEFTNTDLERVNRQLDSKLAGRKIKRKPKARPVNAEVKDIAGIAGKRLLSFLERIERLEEEKAALAEDIKDVYGKARSAGFDTKTMRRIIKLRKVDPDKIPEEIKLLNLYTAALGMQGDFFV